VYQTDGTAGFYYYNGSSWVAITAGLDGTNVARQDATNIFNEDNFFIGDKNFIVDITPSANSQITLAGREVSIQEGLEVYNGPDTHVPASVSGALNVNQSYFGGVDDRSVNYIKTPKVEITTEPVDISDATTKKYVDDLIANLQNQITAAQVVVGEFYQGGVVFYILQSDDLGYVVGETHGLIAAIEDQSDGIRWFDSDGLGITGASGTAVGTGSVNTDAIINNYTPTGTDFAAGLARAYNGGGYTDWFLPSVAELNKMIINRSAINSGGEPHGGSLFGGDNIIGNELCDCTTYWSSSEDGPDFARIQDWFSTDFPQSEGHKSDDIQLVRAVRAF
jgi:hypothetical protein